MYVCWRTEASSVALELMRQVPRLSTTMLSIVVVALAGRVNESVCGSVVIAVLCITKPLRDNQSMRLIGSLAPKGSPLTFAQTVSPRLNEILGVVQSAA